MACSIYISSYPYKEHFKFRMKRVFLSAALMVATLTTAAQQDSTKYLDEVIVSASKRAVKQNETGKVVTVVTKKQLEQMPGKNLGEILNTTPGLNINGAENNLGTNPTPYLRGAGSSQTLILLDGMPLFDPSGIGNEFDLNNFDIHQIERIEILKGAQSTLYGSDAATGVINIISKKESTKPLALSADLAAGSYETYKGAISLDGTLAKKHTYQLSYSKVNSAGFSSAYDSTGKGNFDKDGFNRDAFQVKYGFKASEKTTLQFFGKYTQFGGDIDAGAYTDDRDYTYKNKNTIAGIMVNHQFTNGFLQLQYQYNKYHRSFVDDSTHIGGFSKYQNGDYKGFSHYAELYTNWKPATGIEILAGVDFRNNSTDQFYFYVPGAAATPLSSDSAKTNQLSAYTSVHVKAKKGFQMEVGSRWNYHSTYGTNYTSSINPFYLFDNGIKIYGSVASAYQVPSLYQLFSEYGNKELSPENTLNFEAGLQYSSDFFGGRITGFRRLGTDVILFYTDPVTYAGQYRNGNSQKDFGLEAEARLALAPNLTVTANYAYVDGKVTAQTETGKDTSFFNLYKRPKNTLNISLEYQPLQKLFTALRFKTVSKAFEAQYNDRPHELDGYYTLNFTASFKINQALNVYADLQNITDQQYFTIRGYNTKGFNFMAGARFRL